MMSIIICVSSTYIAASIASSGCPVIQEISWESLTLGGAPLKQLTPGNEKEADEIGALTGLSKQILSVYHSHAQVCELSVSSVGFSLILLCFL